MKAKLTRKKIELLLKILKLEYDSVGVQTKGARFVVIIRTSNFENYHKLEDAKDKILYRVQQLLGDLFELHLHLKRCGYESTRTFYSVNPTSAF